MTENTPTIESYEDLLARKDFRPRLEFHPQGERNMKDVLWPYRFSEKVNCGISACRQLHFQGYLITTSDGFETGIGADCGRKYFGLKFTRQRQLVDKEVARRQRVKSIKDMIDQLPVMVTTLAQIKADYLDLQEMKQRLMGAIGPSIYAALKQRAEKDGARIMRSVRLTGRDLEAHYATTNKRSSRQDDAPYREEVIATLEGLPFIRARFKDMLVTNLLEPLQLLSACKTAEVEDWKVRELQKTAKWVGEVPQSLIKAQELIAAGRLFFKSENIANLVHIGAPEGPLTQIIADLKASEQTK
ncbi:hypothetical protein [Pseudomonas orientalis]|uniref:Uncharacterized protein n=1 Tax=Pseudomonas orientalis TaxID=76758 RepID=A0A1H2GWR0_9PSED|nr:hypothetical protein [Pseudomonas orientalis]KRP64703.1 hypothetical protein TU82_17190 [Pseudomonas orientalis]SDU24080.1 hypothetical protein SAMN04490197_4134 [Pseudomonas orientalis]